MRGQQLNQLINNNSVVGIFFSFDFCQCSYWLLLVGVKTCGFCFCKKLFPNGSILLLDTYRCFKVRLSQGVKKAFPFSVSIKVTEGKREFAQTEI